MRAVRHDRDTATAMGIPAQRVYVLTFGVGFALAAFGGAVESDGSNSPGKPLTARIFIKKWQQC